MAKKKAKPTWTDFEGNTIGVGSRVELKLVCTVPANIRRTR